uniref:Prion protein, related sequence 3 n=1 Tax=Fundulus heteroclitus TaxID=8078 RepID=A0A3Q2Q248_FUNHE
MQLKSSLLGLLLLLFHFPFLLAKRGGGGGGGRGRGGKKWSTSSRGGTNSNTGYKNNQGSASQAGNPNQPGQAPGGGAWYPGGYPRQQAGGYYPGVQSPYGAGGNRGYPGGYINVNPNNKILSPGYGGSFGYGGYGSRGGSPFAQSVQRMGRFPDRKSTGFGRRAAIAAGGGAVVGMALGFGLGRFPRPYFQFRNPQEEYYYNNYMYSKYGTRSTDANDYSRDYRYRTPPERYGDYMDSCMWRTDLLSAEKPEANNEPAASPWNDTTADTGGNATRTNSSGAGSPATPTPLSPSSQGLSSAGEDDTVSIVEIGYPALIEQ